LYKHELHERFFEKKAHRQGFRRVAGIDEAGRGPLAGPVVAAACVLPEGVVLEGLDDSKALSEKKRKELFEKIITTPGVDYGLGIIDVDLIDEVNILQATFMAMLAAVSKLSCLPDYLLIDGSLLPKTDIPKEAIIQGDRLCFSIAAASILAKYTRDQLMLVSDEQFPEYGFAKHKGYGTKAHLDALSVYGPSPIHRKTFGPVKRYV
jgi:ribonuclease HII